MEVHWSSYTGIDGTVSTCLFYFIFCANYTELVNGSAYLHGTEVSFDIKCMSKVKIIDMYLLWYFIIFLWPTVPSLFIRIAIYTEGTKRCTLCLSSTLSCQILFWLGVAKSVHDLSWYWWCMNVLHLQDLYINYVGSLSKVKRLSLNIRVLPPLISGSVDKSCSKHQFNTDYK